MHAELLESAAASLVWQALCTDEGEPSTASSTTAFRR